MSSKVMSHASELAGVESGRAARLWERVKRLAAAISEGRDAEFAYRQLVSRGVAARPRGPPSSDGGPQPQLVLPLTRRVVKGSGPTAFLPAGLNARAP